MSTPKEMLREKWKALPPKTRQFVAIGGLFGGLIVASSMIMSVQQPPARKQLVEPSETNLLTPRPKDRSIETLAASSDAAKDQIVRLNEQLSAERENTQTALRRLEEMQDKQRSGESGVNADVIKEMMQMKQRLDEMERAKIDAKNGPKLNDPLGIPTASNGGEAAPVASEPPVAPKLRIVQSDKASSGRAAPAQEAPRIAYLPAGSMFEGVLLNGMDAPTSQVAQKNPVPALMRIKSDALLPNNFNHDVKECFVLVSGFGVLSSERAQLRTETMSCVRENGQVVEVKIDGYVVGEDGRVAPRGRLVSKQGQMIAKALAAGVLSGFGQALTPAQVPQLNINPAGTVQTQTADMSTIAQTGAARGLSDASKAASQFFIEMAREMTPVVEIDAGRKLTVVLIKGVELK